MADIFVSYARADKARVAPLVAALERHGWSVWWDPAITPGQEFDDLIAEEIDKAKAVVVVWSPASVTSRWVRGEAREAADRGILVPVRFDKARLPIDVRAVHTTDIDDWKEDSKSAAFQEVAAALALLLKDAKRVAPEPAESATSIAVLPFVNLSSDPEQEYFSDGLSEELLNQLAQMKGLRVISRTSCFAFKGKNEDVRLIGQKLDAAHILEGSVRKAGNRLRITAQLVKSSDASHLWSNTYDRQLDDVFAIQDDVARAVAKALGIALGIGQSTLVPGGTANVEAYDLYLRGMAQLAHVSAQGTQRAIMLLREAVELDPRFYLAWGLLTGCYVNAIVWDYDTSDASRQLFEEASERAKACAPEPWMRDNVTGGQFVIKRDWLAAQTAFDKARETAPAGQVQAGGYPALLTDVGRAAESVAVLQRLVRDDPQAPTPMLSFMLDCLGRHDEAEAEFRRQRSLPTDPLVPEFWSFLRTLAREGSQTAKLQLRRVIGLMQDQVPLFGEVLARFDDKSAALTFLRQAAQEPAAQHPLAMFGIAWFAAYFGDEALATDCLRAALVEMRSVMIYYLWHPLLASARKTEGFKQLVRDLGLYTYWKTTGHWGDFARAKGDDDFEIIR